MAQVLFIDAEREGYTPAQVSETTTVGELASTFSRLAEYHGYDMPVYLRHDNGYTYGGVNGWVINVEECDDVDEWEDEEEDEEEDEDWEDEDDEEEE